MRLALAAIALALLAGPAAAGPDGQYLYRLHCSGCHGWEGAASEGRIPKLAGVIGHYMKDKAARTFAVQAPGIMNSGLSDEDMTALMNWLVPAFGGDSLNQPFA